ncbi:MAG: hypothetical protein HRT34_11140, partial [Alcanivorax sp.]|nr:hypothetical protein [Alcanivorax sp.]
MAISDWPKQERPREKLLGRGAGARSDAELLAIFLRTGSRGRTAVDLGRDILDRAIEGIDAARKAGFEKIKINTVLMRHRNEHELWDLIEFARKRDLLLRFIELMPVSTTQVLTEENFLPAGEAKKLIEFRLGELTPRPDFRTNG